MWPILEIMLGLSLIVFTLIIHSVGMYLVMHRFELNWPTFLNEKNEFRRQFYFGHLVIIMLLTHILEVFVIASVLLGIHALSDFRTAFYFTGETYTTLGFGDIIPVSYTHLTLPT